MRVDSVCAQGRCSQAFHSVGVSAGRAVPGAGAGALRWLLAMLLPRSLAAPSQHRPCRLVTSTSSVLSPATTRQLGRSCKSRVAAGHDRAGPLSESAAPGEPGTDASLQQKLRQLETALDRHNELYYNQQRPEISDAAYDDLKRQYRQLAGRLQGAAPEEVPLPVGAPMSPSGALHKAPHPAPMLSLAAVDSRDQVAAWMHKTARKLAAAAGGGGGGGGGASGGMSGNKKRGRSASSKPPALVSAAAAGAAAAEGALPPGLSHRWVVEPKVDGLAVRVLYRRTADGTYQLAEAATRGDGAVGEDITHNALYGDISGLPRSLRIGPSAGGADVAPGRHLAPPPRGSRRTTPASSASASASRAAGLASLASSAGPDWVDVRGEVFLRAADLLLVNAEQEAAGQPPFANARNAASGSVRLLDPSECRRRRLSFVAYAAVAPKPTPPSSLPSSLPSSASASPPGSAAGGAGGAGAVAGVGALHGSHWETLQWLQTAGFSVSADNRLCCGLEEAVRAAEEWMGRRETLGYDADGAVIKLDDTTLYDVLGTAGSDPRWAVAWKFPAGEAVTLLEGVELSVGRQGQITPVALLSPVELGGVTVRRASLHNVGLAAALGLHCGDAVVLRRSGDVIPQVLRALPELRPPGAAPWQPPTACPACGGPVRLLPVASPSSGGQLVCDNPRCEAKSERQLLHFATVCLSGSGVSRGVVSQLVGGGLVRELPDLYRLDEAALAALPGFGPARIAALRAALVSSRRLPASVLLRGLNIRLVGEVAATALGAAFPHLTDLAAAGPERIAEAAGVGPAVARSVAEWFQRPSNRDLIRALGEAGLQCIATQHHHRHRHQQPVEARQPTALRATLPAAAISSGRGSGRAAAPGAAALGSPRGAGADIRGLATLTAAPGGEQLSEGEAGRGGEGAAAATAAVRGMGRSGLRLVGVAGLVVCVTGTLQGPHGTGMPRAELQRLLEDAGAEFHRAVKRDTQVLLVGHDAGGRKCTKAAARGVQVVSEPEFWRRFLFGSQRGAEPAELPPRSAGSAILPGRA